MKLDDQRKKLIERHNELSHRLAAIKKDLQKSYNADSSEQASERQNDEVLEALANNCELEISLIGKAMQRLEEGEYGYCTQCGEAINESRLDAYPHVDLCMKCAD